MQVIAKRTLRQFWERQPRAEMPLRTWFALVSDADWSMPSDIKNQFGAAVDFVGDNRVIFNIGGNKYRLIVHVSYEYRCVLIKFVGTHQEYNRIDPEAV